MRQLVTLIVLLGLATPLAASASLHTANVPAPERSPRVRAGDARSAVLLTEGLERSETIRQLVQHLEQRDVIVYIEMQLTLRKRLAGMLTWVGTTTTHRYVRISLNPDLSTTLAIATLGHELQHALEVAHAPEVVCATTLAKYYAGHGDANRSDGNGWDTAAARLAGDNVRRELVAGRTVRVADSIQPLHPEDWLIVYRRARGMLPP